MSSSALRVIAILLALAAVVLGYLGYQASQSPVAESPEPVAEVPPPEPVRLPLLVAARDIPVGQTLDEEDVTTVFVEKLPEDTYSEQTQVLGQQTRIGIAAGDLILKDHFYDFSNLVNAIGPGERAIAVRVDEVTGVGGFVQPGDYVDVFLFLAAGQETGDNSSAQRILSAARVLAYGNTVDASDAEAITEKAKLNADKNGETQQVENSETTDDSAEETAEEPSGKKSKTAVLAVADKDLSALLLAESTGRLRLALLGPEALAEKNEADKKASKAELAEAEKQQRQFVTLDVFKVTPAKAATTTQQVRQPDPTPAPQPQPKVTVHRGTSEDAVTVDREN